MASGYSYNGACYSTANEMFLKFVASYPQLSNNYLTHLVSATQGTSGGKPAITFTVSSSSVVSSGAAVSRTSTIKLEPCQIDNFRPDQSLGLMFVVVLFFAAMLGFRTGFGANI